MAWLAGWVSIPGVSLFFYLLVLFPDGHLPSRRWRPVAWLYGSAHCGFRSRSLTMQRSVHAVALASGLRSRYAG